MKNKARVLAFYLPQYHPIKENDEWWGRGFTEWVSVANARPLFKGHRQPLIPGELGFYDLRLEESRCAQADLAREHGVEGFCYWHYWLGKGRRLLERPFNDVLTSNKPDFPFCLAWANHSWKGVFFGAKNKCLVEQTYPGKDDYKAHFEYVVDAFCDTRYIKVEGKVLFMIYRPKLIPNCLQFTDYWRELADEAGLEGIHFVGEGVELEDKDKYGLDAVSYSNHRAVEHGPVKNRYMRYILSKLRGFTGLKVYDYKDAIPYFVKPGIAKQNEYPSLVPGWDTTARLGRDAVVLKGSTPKLFKEHVSDVLSRCSMRPFEENIVFLKSWNEWAEGNYVEPDRAFGRGFLEALKSENVLEL